MVGVVRGETLCVVVRHTRCVQLATKILKYIFPVPAG